MSAATAQYGAARCNFQPLSNGLVWISLHGDPGFGPMSFESSVVYLSDIDSDDPQTLRWVAGRLRVSGGTVTQPAYDRKADALERRAAALEAVSA